MNDKIKHPEHYTKYNVEVIDITRYLPFCLGNVVKYVLRAPYKSGAEDCNKALQYLKWCKARPVAMFLYDSADFMKNLVNFRTALRAENSPFSKLQCRFLTALEATVYWGENFDDMIPLIKQLREILEAMDGNAGKQSQAESQGDSNQI